MRKQFVTSTETILAGDPRAVLLLGDIGVFGFQNAFQKYPERVYNIGILEQSTIGAAAGLAMTGLTPLVHTIAPFLVERAFEQLKDDFCFQGLGGNFISVGGSYDYAALGATHHCPDDVGILKQLPGMEIIVPGTSSEFDTLLTSTYHNGHPTYFRLSERENDETQHVSFGKASVVQKGTKATVIAIGPMLKPVLEACKGKDVTVLYYTTVAPFDSETLRMNATTGKILLCEPYYRGVLTHDVTEALFPMPVQIKTVGVPHAFLTHYGKAEDHDQSLGMTAEHISTELSTLLS